VGGRALRGSERRQCTLLHGMGGGVEAPRRAGLVRGGLDTRSRRAAFYCGFNRFSFLLAIDVDTPVLLVPTQGHSVPLLSRVLSIWIGEVALMYNIEQQPTRTR
jgi:hypothetical protein